METSNQFTLEVLAIPFRTLFSPIGGYWFLHALIIMQISLMACSKLLSESKAVAWLWHLSLMAVAVYFGLIGSIGPIYFFIGFMLSQLLDRSILTKNCGSMFVLFLLSAFYISMGGRGTEMPLLSFLWPVVVLLSFWNWGELAANCRSVEVVSWIGRNTLVILVSHAFFILALKPLSSIILKFEPTGVGFSLLTTCLTVIGGILCSVISDWMKISQYIFGVDEVYSPANLKCRKNS